MFNWSDIRKDNSDDIKNSLNTFVNVYSKTIPIFDDNNNTCKDLFLTNLLECLTLYNDRIDILSLIIETLKIICRTRTKLDVLYTDTFFQQIYQLYITHQLDLEILTLWINLTTVNHKIMNEYFYKISIHQHLSYIFNQEQDVDIKFIHYALKIYFFSITSIVSKTISRRRLQQFY